MHLIRTMLMLPLLAHMTACEGDGPSISDRAHFEGVVEANYSAPVRERLLPEASRLAKARYLGPDAQWEFIANFFSGYEQGAKELLGTTIIGNGNGADQKGFDAGERYYREIGEFTLLDFGFEFVEVAGTHTRTNFEESAFRPYGKAEMWWADFRSGVWDGITEETSRPPYAENKRVLFRGYLDPREGGLGHFNMYDREIVVVEIVEASS